MQAKSVSFITIIILITTIIIGGYFFQKKADENKVTAHWEQTDNASQESINHEVWQQVLDDYLISEHTTGVNRVDYASLIDDKELLDQYIQSMSVIDPRNYNRHEQMAYWINLYNALTVKLIIDNYPTKSITKLGKTTIAFGPWDDKAITLAGKVLTLNDIEHRILRPIWQDYRIHFAVNCASIGCPNLQPNAFTAQNLEQLLNRGAAEYLNHPRGIRFEINTLILSSLFEWYSEDFGSSTEEILSTLSRYVPEDKRQKLKNYQGNVRYEYDWGLNEDS